MNTRRDVMIGRIFGIIAALAYGTSTVLVRHGVADLASPLVGAAVALLSGTLVMGGLGIGRGEANLGRKKRAVALMLVSGIFAASGIMASFFALSMSPVVIVSPVQSTSPLFALLWSYLFLGKTEKITPRIVLGTVLVVGGVALVTVGMAPG